MIPILYDIHATTFTTNGMGRLSDCTSCVVTEERNGIYECEFQYPITGKWYEYMRERGGIVVCIHDDQQDVQPFDIYAFSAPIDGIVTFYAHHISYRLNRIVAQPFTATSCADAMSQIVNKCNGTCPFTFWTDKATGGDFILDHPEVVRAFMGGQTGSFLDVFGGGDYKFDNWVVRLYANRGSNTDVTIRYGKNLADLTWEYDKSGTYNAIQPYWKNSDGTVVVGGLVAIEQTNIEPWTDEDGNYIQDENGTNIEFEYGDILPISMDFSSDFDEEPSPTALQYRAEEFLTANQPWIPKQNITVDFVQLWQTKEYENVAALQRVGLCDRVSIYYPELGVTAENQKVIKVVYNVLTERFDSMELGEPKTTLADDIRSSIRDEFENMTINGSFESILQAAIDHATELITGGLGGHVLFTLDASGKPQEILIMDTESTSTAVNVLRINQNGIGFSSSGYNGPYTTAWTLDGSFVADFITAGHLSANMIQGGTLTLGGTNNGNGVMRLLDTYGNQVGLFNKDGVTATSGNIGGWTITDTTIENRDAYERGVVLDSANNFIKFLSYANASPYVDTGLYIGQDPNNYYRQSLIFSRKQSGTETYIVKIYATPYQNGSTLYINALESNGGITFGVDGNSMLEIGNNWININVDELELYDLRLYGDLNVRGNKNRIIPTETHGERLLYAYETTEPYFGDIGEAETDEDGKCRVEIEPIFSETVDLNEYCVFLQKEGKGDIWVAEKTKGYFTVEGTPGLKFSWELKAKQIDHKGKRLELFKGGKKHENR